jgi:hypothetical protein
MKTELKKAIIKSVFDNINVFQISNYLTGEVWRAYIYDSTGNYLIGGEDVANFIKEAINLIKDN